MPIALASALPLASSAAAPGGYTTAQAAQGTTVFAAGCAACHAQNLAGGAGPAFAGSAFKKSIGANYQTAAQLFDFISKQMPQSAPGSLSRQEYLAVSACIISKNGYGAGSTALSAATTANVKLANAATNETARRRPARGKPTRSSAPRCRRRRASDRCPPGPNVTITDEMLASADCDAKNWLLGGKNYSNHRYSALDQITAQNVGTLTPVALVQTGYTASFETTPVVVEA